MIYTKIFNKLSNTLLICLSIVIGLGFKYLPNVAQLIIGIPMSLALVVYGLVAVESKYGKLTFILIATFEFLYFLAIYFNSNLISDVILLAMAVVALLILMLPNIEEKKRGREVTLSKLNVVTIVILFIMIFLYILSRIYV